MVADMYKHCEVHCSHDLGHGALLGEVLSGEDGPYPDDWYGWGNRAPVGVPVNVRQWMDSIRQHTIDH